MLKPIQRIDQVVPAYVSHDAIGHHISGIQNCIKSQGFESEVFADDVDQSMSTRSKSIEQFVGPSKKP